MKQAVTCASCSESVEFEVPELTGGHWHTNCTACGLDTELKADVSNPGELARFSATGVFLPGIGCSSGK